MTTPRMTMIAIAAAVLLGGASSAVRWKTMPPPPPPAVAAVMENVDSAGSPREADPAEDVVVLDSLPKESAGDSIDDKAGEKALAMAEQVRSDSALHAAAESARNAAAKQKALLPFPATREDSGVVRLMAQSSPAAAAELFLSLDDSLAALIVLALPARQGAAVMEALAPDHRGAIGRYMLRLPPLPIGDQ